MLKMLELPSPWAICNSNNWSVQSRAQSFNTRAHQCISVAQSYRFSFWRGSFTQWCQCYFSWSWFRCFKFLFSWQSMKWKVLNLFQFKTACLVTSLVPKPQSLCRDEQSATNSLSHWVQFSFFHVGCKVVGNNIETTYKRWHDLSFPYGSK